MVDKLVVGWLHRQGGMGRKMEGWRAVWSQPASHAYGFNPTICTRALLYSHSTTEWLSDHPCVWLLEHPERICGSLALMCVLLSKEKRGLYSQSFPQICLGLAEGMEMKAA
jgi:hypothetical protein